MGRRGARGGRTADGPQLLGLEFVGALSKGSGSQVLRAGPGGAGGTAGRERGEHASFLMGTRFERERMRITEEPKPQESQLEVCGARPPLP